MINPPNFIALFVSVAVVLAAGIADIRRTHRIQRDARQRKIIARIMEAEQQLAA